MNSLRFKARAVLLLALLGVVCSGVRTLAQGAPPFVPGRLLVQFRPDVPAQQVRALIAAARANDAGEIPQIGVHILQLPPQASEIAAARAFAQRPEVAFAERDYILMPAGTPNDTYYGSEWHLPKISAPTAWNSTTGSSSVIIAILDTGCDPTHPDLAPKYVPGWNFYDNNSDTHDVNGHGTAVAGAAAACSNNGTGVASLAWGCLVMPIRISDASGSASSSAMANGLVWAADHGARVANISYNMVGWLTAVTTAAQYFASKGGVVTASAGNSGSGLTYSDNPYVLTISATDSNDSICSWSCFGTPIDLAAPGNGIYTTCNGGGYAAWAGTSFSAPIVAGVAALMISANPNLTGQQVHDLLEQSADDLGAPGWDAYYGYGRVNAAKAVSLALNDGGTSTADTTPPTISFNSPTNGATVSGSISVQVAASDDTGVSSVTLYLDGTAVASASAAPYTFAWNTTAVSNGTHTLKAVAADAAGNTASASISVTVSNAADTAPPTCSILSPASNSTVGNPLAISASASDNVGVTKVELYVDGKLSATDTSSPYSFSVNTKKWARGSSHTLQCKAYDAAGNVGASQIVTVSK